MISSRSIIAKKGDVLTIKLLGRKCEKCNKEIEYIFNGPKAVDGNDIVNTKICQQCLKSTQNS